MRLLLAVVVLGLLSTSASRATKTQTCSSYTNITGTTHTTCRNPKMTCRSTTSNTGTTRTECRR